MTRVETKILSRFTKGGVTEHDVDRINTLLRTLHPCGTQYTRDEVERLTDDERNIFYVAHVEGEIVGMALLRRVYTADGTKSGTIEKVVVDERYRRRGIGTLLLSRLVSIARQGGASVLTLMMRHERGVHIFYEKLGFDEVVAGDPEHVKFAMLLREKNLLAPKPHPP